MNTTCKHKVCPATISDTALCECTLERMDTAYLEQEKEIQRLREAINKHNEIFVGTMYEVKEEP